MKAFGNFIVNRRKFLLAVFVLLTVLSAWLATTVNTNRDLSLYLPIDSPTRIGSNIMTDEFGDDETTQLYLMFTGLTEDESAEIYQELQGLPPIEAVAERVDASGEQVLFTLTLPDEEAEHTQQVLESRFSSYELTMTGAAEDFSMIGIMIPVTIVFLLVLFLTGKSWLDPLVIVANILIAIILNMGTNVIFPHVSNITLTIAPVLQLALSANYSILLLNRYREEKELGLDKATAMKSALEKSFRPICASSVTTILGLLMMLAMSFTLGADMGLVLAKGVFFSLVCVFFVMPALLLFLDSAMEKTKKPYVKFNMATISAFSCKYRYGFAALFVAIFAIGFYAYRQVEITYRSNHPSVAAQQIFDVFPPENPLIVVYDNEDEDKISQLIQDLAQNPYVANITAFANTAGVRVTSNDLSETLGLSPLVTDALVNGYLGAGTSGSEIILGDLLDFLLVRIATDEQLSALITPELAANFGATAQMPALLESLVSSEAFAQLAGIDNSTADFVFALYGSSQNPPSEQVELLGFLEFVDGYLTAHPTFQSQIPEELLPSLASTLTLLTETKSQLVGDNHSRLIVTTILPEESPETIDFLNAMNDNLGTHLENDFYVVGNSAMDWYLSETFPHEQILVTVLSVIAMFITVALTFRSLSLPILLLSAVQAGIFIAIGTSYFQGHSMGYLALIIVQCILIGATIDYGIMYTSYYLEAREKESACAAMTTALNLSMPTIMTSGLILFFSTLLAGFTFNDAIITEILFTLASGTFAAMVIIIFILPSAINTFDKFISNKKS